MTFYTINSDMFNNECFTSVINFVIIFILVEKLKNKKITYSYHVNQIEKNKQVDLQINK